MKKQTYIKKPPVIRIPFKPSFPPSEEQLGVFTAIDDPSKPNMHVEASPGSGKSTTLKWAMTLNRVSNSAILAFGKAIAEEIEPQCPSYVDVGTCHSFGRKAIAGKYGNFLMLKNDKVKWIVRDMFPNYNPDNFSNKEKNKAWTKLIDVCNLVSKLKVNLVHEADRDGVIKIMDQYNIEVENPEEVIGMLPAIFDKICENPKVIDFDDMLWLPIRLDLKVPQYDMMYLDERQDLNSLMIEYVFRMAKGRIMTVGDKNQSIFGFSGADVRSTERLIEKFGGLELPLNVCYRCGTDIVAYAATIYDKIKPFDKNPKGIVERVDELDYNMPEGSMILSRRNASLIKPCFALLKQGRKAIIKGKNIGEGLIKLIESTKSKDAYDLIDNINEHRAHRVEQLLSRKEPSATMIEAVNDQCDCVLEIAGGCSTVAEVISKINILFDETTAGIMLSSIHRSKGLEADHVTIIDYARVRMSNDKMSDEDRIQEKNLEFVAITRAIKRLTLVG